MLKLIKYELIKQRTSKLVIGAILVLLEVVFLVGLFVGKETWMAGASGLLIFLAAITFIIVGLEGIITYYHDLRDKSGYMLFMTPYNVYTILGSKILTGFLSIIAAVIVFGGVGFADVTLFFAKYGDLKILFQQILEFFRASWEVYINGEVTIDATLVISLIVQGVFSWVGMMTSAFLAITLCITIFSGMRVKGLISFVIYCVLNVLFSVVMIQIANWIDFSTATTLMAYMVVLDVVFAGACYAATGYILNKELAL